MLLGVAAKQAQQFATPIGADQEHASVLGNVQKNQSTGQAGYDALLPIEGGGVERAISAVSASGEPDLLAIGRPSDALDGEPLAGERLLVAGQVNDGERTAVITL